MVLSPYICILSSLFLKVKIFANASQAKIFPQKSQKFLSKMLTFTSWGTWFTIIDFPNKVVITLTFIKASFKSEIARWVFKTSRTDYFAFGYDAQVFFNLFFTIDCGEFLLAAIIDANFKLSQHLSEKKFIHRASVLKSFTSVSNGCFDFSACMDWISKKVQ